MLRTLTMSLYPKETELLARIMIPKKVFRETKLADVAAKPCTPITRSYLGNALAHVNRNQTVFRLWLGIHKS